MWPAVWRPYYRIKHVSRIGACCGVNSDRIVRKSIWRRQISMHMSSSYCQRTCHMTTEIIYISSRNGSNWFSLWSFKYTTALLSSSLSMCWAPRKTTTSLHTWCRYNSTSACGFPDRLGKSIRLRPNDVNQPCCHCSVAVEALGWQGVPNFIKGMRPVTFLGKGE